MRFEYHPELVEQAVFLASRRNPARECDLHESTDPLYAIADLETRDRAFREVYADRFSRWRVAAALEEEVSCRPLVSGRVARCVVIPASRGPSELVDLLVKPGPFGETDGERTLLVQLRPQTLFEHDALRRWLRRELYHVGDMLDGGFGYVAGDLDGVSWERNVCRDRYAVLWRLYVAGRMMREGRECEREIDALRVAFRRAFRHQGESPRESGIDRILHSECLTHTQIMEWARQPEALLLNGRT